MTWARPDLLALLLLVPAIIILVVAAGRARARVLAQLAALEVLNTLVTRGALRSRAWQAVLAVVATLGLALAAAGPRLGFDWQQQKVEGIAMVVVLDVSRSMDAADVSPSRLERARREITDLLGYLRGDSIGLVIFAAGPYVRIPLTVDYDTFAWAVKDSETGTIRAQGSELSGALDAAAKLLGKAEGAGKAIVLVSDGEAHDAPAALDAALGRLRDAGIRVYALGVGEPAGAPIPVPEGGFKKDEAGNVVLSRLDEDTLKRVAEGTGGAYVRAVASDDDVRALYQGEIRGKLEAAERGVRREKVWRERYQWPLSVALVAMVISAALGIGRRPRRVAAAAAVLLALSLGAPRVAWAGAAQDGMAALKAQQWEKAAQLLGQARVENPKDTTVAQGLAEALYRSGRYREAEQMFDTLATQDDKNKAIHLYNAGNAAYRGGRLTEALKDFQESAKADPKLAPAQTNAGAVQKELLARLQQQPPQQQGQGGDDQQQGQDQSQSDSQQQSSQDGQQQDGQQQDGQQQNGQQDGQQQNGQAGQKNPDGSQRAPDEQGQDAMQQDGEQSAQDAQAQNGQGGADDQGVREQGAQAAGGDQGDPSQLSTAEGDDGTPIQGGDDAPSGNMTKEQAARLVDAVQDGKPRVVVGGRDTEKDW